MLWKLLVGFVMCTSTSTFGYASPQNDLREVQNILASLGINEYTIETVDQQEGNTIQIAEKREIQKTDVNRIFNSVNKPQNDQSAILQTQNNRAYQEKTYSQEPQSYENSFTTQRAPENRPPPPGDYRPTSSRETWPPPPPPEHHKPPPQDHWPPPPPPKNHWPPPPHPNDPWDEYRTQENRRWDDHPPPPPHHGPPPPGPPPPGPPPPPHHGPPPSSPWDHRPPPPSDHRPPWDHGPPPDRRPPWDNRPPPNHRPPWDHRPPSDHRPPWDHRPPPPPSHEHSSSWDHRPPPPPHREDQPKLDAEFLDYAFNGDKGTKSSNRIINTPLTVNVDSKEEYKESGLPHLFQVTPVTPQE